MSFIDPPSPFASLEEWVSFKKEIEAAIKTSRDQEGLAEALKNANQMIDEKTAKR